MIIVNKSSLLIEMLRKNELDLIMIEETKNQSELIEDIFNNDRIVIIANPENHLLAQNEVTADDIVNEHLCCGKRAPGPEICLNQE